MLIVVVGMFFFNGGLPEAKDKNIPEQPAAKLQNSTGGITGRNGKPLTTLIKTSGTVGKVPSAKSN